MTVVFVFAWFATRGEREKQGKKSSSSNRYQFKTITDRFHTLEEFQQALRDAGLESSDLIVGVDFTKSNESSGKYSFDGKSLHYISPESLSMMNLIEFPPQYTDLYPTADANAPQTTVLNPYQEVIKILGLTLEKFDEDGLIPAYGFGDLKTSNHSVFPFKAHAAPCHGFKEVIQRYNEITPNMKLSGPTSFAPIIRKAIETIIANNNQYTILVIVADGLVTDRQETIDAIVEATNHPLSILVVGVGDGPFELMEEFDDALPQRRFDNFQFVHFNAVMTRGNENPEVAFAVACLMEIPDQYKAIRELGLLNTTSS